uniref:AAA family ATPase n=1 Tax=Lachnoclostridium phocaeense TaxID=1871021 RepID=UPI0026DACA81|nr:AAA family ATPase [Lachnoclostridium phocaeense]
MTVAKPRLIIADTDINYIIPLQAKFAEEFPGEIDLEIITEPAYFEQLFASPQKVDVLIVSDQLYSGMLRRHSIGYIFVMMEKYEEGTTDELSINRLFKYTSIREIFNEIVGKSSDVLNVNIHTKKACQTVLVCSAAGGTGKTTVAMGLAGCLTRNYKRVLYINAERLQTFQYRLENKGAVSAPEVYMRLADPQSSIYQEIRHVIRREEFSYLPPFKAPLMSLGLHYSVYRKIAASAKKTNEYDFIIIDADPVFDEEKAALIGEADKVVIVTKQTEDSVRATDLLVSNINGIGGEKYLFVCNDFRKDEENYLTSSDIEIRFQVNEYIGHFPAGEKITADKLARDTGIQKTAFLIM